MSNQDDGSNWLVDSVAEIKQLQRQLAEANQALGDLLAIIHGDGGHYQSEHGTQKAAEDAAKVVYALRERAEQAEAQFEVANKTNQGMSVRIGELIKQLTKAEAVVKALRLIEWSMIGASGRRYCFACRNGQGEGHTDTCPVGKALAGLA